MNQISKSKISLTINGQRLKRGVLLSLFVMLCSCSNDNQDLQKKFEEVRSRPGRPIEKMPEFKPLPSYAYPSHLKRRNPFISYQKPVKKVVKKKKDVNAPNLHRKKQTLEKFKLRDLRMVGFLRQNGVVWGLVSAPDEKVHKVTIGSYLGLDYGRVVSIGANKIRLVETYKVNKDWKKRDVVLRLDSVKKDTVSHKQIKIEEFVR